MTDEQGQCVLAIDWAHEMVVLTCSHPMCLRPIGVGMRNYPEPMEIELPDECLPETAVLIRAKHLATHSEQGE